MSTDIETWLRSADPGIAKLIVDQLALITQLNRDVIARDDEIAALKAKLSRAKDALRPFAEHIQSLGECDDDKSVIVHEFIYGSDLVVADVSDLRRAAAALAELDKP